MNNHDLLKTWNIYQSAWGPVGETERRRLLEQSVADDIAYADPFSQANGFDELVVRIAKSQEQFPGARFENDSFLEHHEQGIFHWTMYDGKGEIFVKGISFGRFGEDGRLAQATGFFRVPGRD